MSNKTFTLLVDDYIKLVKFHRLEILPQMISKILQNQRQRKSSPIIIENFPKKEKASFIYGELQCMESQKKIKELIIQSQNIIKLHKNFFQNLSNLTFLDLSNNSISKISKKILQLPNIKHLILNNNLISVIPFYLSELLSLEEIQLENNLIQLIPINIQNFPHLKILNICSNKLTALPVELGLVKTLKRIKLEWFEYVHPNIDIDLKDMNLIQSFKLVLKEQLLQSKIYIDFHTFLSKFSQDKLMDESINTFETEKTECYNNSNYDIFHALNNNYIGIIKSFLKENPDIINSKDQNGKTPLYLSMQPGRREIYELLLEKINIKKLESENDSYSILFRVIRMKNFSLLVKLHNLGISLDKIDEKGNNVFHILFSVFINNNYDQCAQIGNYLIEQGLDNYNSKNKDGWAPIHIAAKHANFVCLEWIGFINKILEKKKKKLIDVNIKGKKNWTALHLVVSSYKYTECIQLLNLGSNVFAKNSDGRSPRYITNNFFLAKMLNMKENDIYSNKIANDSEIKNNINKLKITNENYYSFKSKNKLTNQNNKNITKDILISNNTKNNDSFILMEKYEYLKVLSLNDNKDEVQKECKEILFKIDFSKNNNGIIISDILSIISKYNLTKLIPDLKKLLEKKKNFINSNIFLFREFNNTIQYLEQVKNGKINILTKINIYINSNTNNIVKENKNSKRGSKNIILKTVSEMPSYKIGGDEITFSNKSIRNKLLNKTSNKKMSNSRDKNNGVNLGKKFSSEMKKLQEKHLQESANSVDFELDDTIKNI